MKPNELQSEKLKHPNGRRWPLEEKRAALEALDSGLFTVLELMAMYEIGTRDTLKRWREQLSRSSQTRKHYSIKEKRRIAYEVYNGTKGLDSAMAEYGIHGKRTISGWIDKYVTECEIGLPMQKHLPQPEKSTDGSSSDELKSLIKELEEAKLKALALETLIEVAEEELGIEIRKKPGAKPSEECE